MKPKKDKKRFAWNPKNKVLYNMMASTPGVIVVNWLFQGMLGMEKSELLFHVLFDIILGIILIFIFSLFFSSFVAILLAVFLAHSLNWLLNSHFWVMGRYIGITYNHPDRIWEYIKTIKERTNKPYISGVIIFGNMTRGGEVKCNSDIDVRFIVKRGLLNVVKTNLFAMQEKIRAFLSKIPLDLYVYDKMGSLDKLREDEKPIILHDPEDILKTKYEQRGYVILD